MDSSKPNKSRATLSRELASSFVGFRQGTGLVPSGAEVTPVDLPHLKGGTLPTYRQIKSTFKADLTTRDSRFSLSGLVADQLSVEEEEEKRFQKKVAEEVAAQLSVLKSEAETNGYNKGSEAGKAAGFEQEKLRLAQHMEKLAACVGQLESAKDQLGSQYEKTLLDLAFRVAETVVRREIADRPEIISSTISAILERVAKDDDVRIRLPQKTFEVIEQIKSELSNVPRVGRITYDIDVTLPEGACVVQSLSGEIASFIDNQLLKLKTEISLQGATQQSVGA